MTLLEHIKEQLTNITPPSWRKVVGIVLPLCLGIFLHVFVVIVVFQSSNPLGWFLLAVYVIVSHFIYPAIGMAFYNWMTEDD